jgi:hypothetical protein
MIFALFASFEVNARHELTYFVYFETEYYQGSWVHYEKVEKTNKTTERY